MRFRAPAYPALMTFKEKHDDEIYIVNSAEETHRIAVLKIRERYGYGYYPKVAEYERELKQHIDRLIKQDEISEEVAPRTIEELESLRGSEAERAAALFAMDVATLEGLPKSVSKGIFEKANHFQKALPTVIANYARDMEDARDIERIVHSEHAEAFTKERRGREYNLALWILDSREDYEYEGYSIDSPRAVPTEDELEATRTAPEEGE